MHRNLLTNLSWLLLCAWPVSTFSQGQSQRVLPESLSFACSFGLYSQIVHAVEKTEIYKRFLSRSVITFRECKFLITEEEEEGRLFLRTFLRESNLKI